MTLSELTRTLPAARRIDAIYPYTDPVLGEGSMLLMTNGITRELPSVSVTLVLRAYANLEDKDYRALSRTWRGRSATLSPPLPISLELTLTALRYRRSSHPHQQCYAYINSSHRLLLRPGSARSAAVIEFDSGASLTLLVSRERAAARLDSTRSIFFARLFALEGQLTSAKREFAAPALWRPAPTYATSTHDAPRARHNHRDDEDGDSLEVVL